MTENEACKRIKYRMHTAGQVSAECGMKDLETVSYTHLTLPTIPPV